MTTTQSLRLCLGSESDWVGTGYATTRLHQDKYDKLSLGLGPVCRCALPLFAALWTRKTRRAGRLPRVPVHQPGSSCPSELF
jgi:hypothetical protein